MEAPDKLYIRTGMSRLLYGSKEKSFETDTEYIRKDALLKKISELRTIPHDNAIARDNAFIEVIGIIESL